MGEGTGVGDAALLKHPLSRFLLLVSLSNHAGRPGVMESKEVPMGHIYSENFHKLFFNMTVSNYGFL